MKKIDSKVVEITRPVEPVFYVLSDFRNLKQVPNDKVENFQCDYDHCSFSVNNMAEVKLRISDRKPFEYITIMNEEPLMGFNFAVNIIFDKLTDNSFNLSIEANVDGNAFTLMMFSKQIKNGMDTVLDNIKNALEGGQIPV